MDHDLLVEQLLDRCKGVSESIWQAPDLQSVASTALAICAQRRQVARAMLQAQTMLEAQQGRSQDVTRGCPDASVQYVHTRTVSPEPLFGTITIPVRTFQGNGCAAAFRPDAAALGGPAAGDCTDDVRALQAPGAAERPHRVANDLLQRCTGVVLSSRGAQSLIDRTAQDLPQWQAGRTAPEVAAVAEASGAGDGAAAWRVEIAMDGVMAHIDGRWQAAKGGTILVRRLEAQAEEPTRGAVLAHRDVGGLGSAADLVVRMTQGIREAGWARISSGEILGEPRTRDSENHYIFGILSMNNGFYLRTILLMPT